MKKINSPEKLIEWRRRIISETPYYDKTIVISSGTCGQASGSLLIIEAFTQELKKRGLETKVRIKITGCHGFCEMEPNIIIYPEEIYYKKLRPKDVPEIIEKTILNNNVIPSLL